MARQSYSSISFFCNDELDSRKTSALPPPQLPPRGQGATARNSAFQLQDGEESFLRHFDAAHGFHALLALFLFLQQLSLAADVAAVALGCNVFAHRADGLTADDLGANRGLDRDLVL